MEGIPAGALVLRPMEKGDMEALLELAQLGGRNVAPEEYVRFLDLEGARGYVISREGILLGACTAIRYFEHGFLGPLLLRENADATGIGIAIIAQLIEGFQADGVPRIEAEAGVTEEIILGRMGFDTVRRTVILERAAAPAPLAGGGSAPMEAHHMLDVGALDAEVAGYGRKEYLLALRNDDPESARVTEIDGEAVGFVLQRHAPRGRLLGPLVTRAAAPDVARALLRDAIANARGDALIALAPDREDALALLGSEGFVPVGELVRMRAGAPRPESGSAATEWALGGRLTG